LKGFQTEAIGTAGIALEIVRGWRPTLVLLDSTLLLGDSLEICREICDLADGPTVLLRPVGGQKWIMADSEIETRDELALLGQVYSLGQGTRVAEPKSLGEPANRDTLDIGPITIQQATRTVFVRGQKAHFGRLEYDLLLALVNPVGQLRSPNELLDAVWGSRRPEDTKTLFVHIRRIRRKIELDMRNPQLIITVRGMGFYFNADAIAPGFSEV